MGVLTCDRSGCSNIMCGIFVPSVGYVCYECKDEFKNYLVAERRKVHSKHDMNDELELFMRTQHGKYLIPENSFDVDEFFRQHAR